MWKAFLFTFFMVFSFSFMAKANNCQKAIEQLSQKVGNLISKYEGSSDSVMLDCVEWFERGGSGKSCKSSTPQWKQLTREYGLKPNQLTAAICEQGCKCPSKLKILDWARSGGMPLVRKQLEGMQTAQSLPERTLVIPVSLDEDDTDEDSIPFIEHDI